MHVAVVGSGPRLVLVHGSGGNSGWPAQQPLAERYTLVMPTRTGYPPNPALKRIDFEAQAGELLEVLEPGDHLFGHSYGGIVALLAAKSADLRSLAVAEPPAFGVASDHPAVAELVGKLAPLWPPELEPEPFLRTFVERIGSGPYNAPSPLPPEIESSVRALMAERGPWEAEIPFAELELTPFPKLVMSGAHSGAFDAVCDVLEQGLGAERAVLPGAAHSLPRAPRFNERLEQFLRSAPGTSSTVRG